MHGEGVAKAYLIFGCCFTQAAARIFEPEKMGYVISREKKPGQKYVTYFLVSEPTKEKPLPACRAEGPDKRQSTFANSSDWHTRKTGRERPGESAPAPGPLFEEPNR